MVSTKRLNIHDTALLLIDVQEKLFPLVERADSVLNTLMLLIKGAQILRLPIIVTEQYPKGLGGTIYPLKQLLGPSQIYHSKTTFSSLCDPSIRDIIKAFPSNQWIVAGIETHVCVLQTARDLRDLGKEVVVLNDAVSSRSIYDYSTAIAELRDFGVRISSCETVLFELLGDSNASSFKEISNLIKKPKCCRSCES